MQLKISIFVEQMKKLIPILFIVFASCTGVHFDKVTPDGGKPQKELSADLLGSYYLADSILPIEKEEVCYNAYYFKDLYKKRDSTNLFSVKVNFSKSLLYYTMVSDSYYLLAKSDTARLSHKHSSNKKKLEGKYVVYEEKSVDTILNLTKEDVVKWYKDVYYLNHKVDNNDWEVYQLVVNKDKSISLNNTNKDDADDLKNFALDTNRSFNNLVHLSDKDFDEFTRKGGFRTHFRLKKYPK